MMKSLLFLLTLLFTTTAIKSQTCGINGDCNGSPVGTSFTSTESECLDYCMTIPGCDYYSFCSDTGICKAMQNCGGFTGASNCVSGERYCIRKTYTKLMVIGGPTATGISQDVEVLDLSSAHQSCVKPADYPIQVWGATGAYFDGKPTVCGSTYFCYTYEVSWKFSIFGHWFYQLFGSRKKLIEVRKLQFYQLFLVMVSDKRWQNWHCW